MWSLMFGKLFDLAAGLISSAYYQVVANRDRVRVYEWLRLNTRDEPGESHVDTVTLAKGTRLTEERVRRACMTDERVFRFFSEPELWSVWGENPRSIYEKRGILWF